MLNENEKDDEQVADDAQEDMKHTKRLNSMYFEAQILEEEQRNVEWLME